MINKIITTVFTITLITGCATGVKMPDQADLKLPTQSEIISGSMGKLNDLPSLTHKRGYVPIIIEEPIVIPKNIREKYISIKFEKDSTFKDLPELLSHFGITAVIKNTVINDKGEIKTTASQEVADYKDRQRIKLENFIKSQGSSVPENRQYKVENLVNEGSVRQKYEYVTEFKALLEDLKIELPSYQGTFQNLLDMLSNMHNISFNWQYGNYMIIEKFGDYTITVPQEEDLITEIKTTLETLGGLEASASLRAGSITYKATKNNHKRITKYINRLSYNTPSVSLQLAVISVTLNKSDNKGFDWGSLKTILGSPLTGQVLDGGSIVGSGGRSDLSGSLATAGLSGGTASVAYAARDVTFEAALNLLDTYGNSRTEQSVMLKTLGGKKANFNTTQEVPYQSGTSSNVNSDGGIVTSDTKTETASVGLKIDITPYYDADNEMLTMDVNFQSSSISGFVDVGNGAKQPSIQQQDFQNKIKMRNDEVVIVGGVTFDTKSENITGLNFFDSDWDINGTTIETTKTAMFIIIKPSIELYGNFEKDEIIK
jgi:hypothetical protein